MQRTKIIRGIIIFALVSLVSTCCYINFEWQEKEINLGLPAGVIKEPFLALEKLSIQLDQSLSVHYQYPALFTEVKGRIEPEPDSVLILSHSDEKLTSEQAEHIVKWVAEGGHLILSMDAGFYKQPRDINHPLWKRFDVSVHFPWPREDKPTNQDESEPTEPVDTELAEALADTQKQDESNSEVSENLPQTDSEEAMSDKADTASDNNAADGDAAKTKQDSEPESVEKLEFDNPYTTEFMPEPGRVFYTYLEKSYRILASEAADIIDTAGDEQGNTFVQMQWEQGQVSFLTEVQIWNNHQLQNAHNAYLYRWLTDGKKQILLFSAPKEASWLVSLFAWSPALVILVFVMLGLFVWYQAVRFGPIYQYEANQQHFFHQHIEAAGEYYWKEKQASRLIKSLQQEITELVIKRWPNYASAGQAEQLNYLAELTQLKPHTIQTALFNSFDQDERSFTRQVSTLQTLRNTL